MTNNNLIYTLCQKIRQSLCNDVLYGVHQILYNLFIHVKNKDSAVIRLETDNKDIVKKINDILMNTIGMPLFAYEETENQYSLDISFDNLLQLYTFLQLKYR